LTRAAYTKPSVLTPGLLALLFFFLALTVAAQDKKDNKERRQYTRISAGPVLSFYLNNKNHTSGSRPRYAFFALASRDIRIYKDFTFMPGLEYAYHGLSFNSYYLAPGYQYLYDGNFDYRYRLDVHEARLNIGVKQVIGIETRNVITGYTACSYVLRYILASKLHVSSNLTGEEVFDDKTKLAFEHDLLRSNMASAVKFIAGAQRNFFKSQRALFFETSFTFSLSRFSIRERFAPSSLNINGSFLQLGLGYKF
jgi:hypothetical protein